jgi:hypothetical protein
MTTPSPVLPCALPSTALLKRYEGTEGYADCWTTGIAGAVTHAAFVEAFYTTPLFKLERTLLRWFASRGATDQDARALANGAAASFAAWTVEARAPDQLLLCDFTGRTRSWLMVAAEGPATRLYFGSAVVPRANRRTGAREMGFGFAALLGFHKLYSRLLLGAARARLRGLH